MKIERIDNGIYVIDDFLTESEEVAINLLLKGLSGDTTGQIMKSCPLSGPAGTCLSRCFV
jgi:hypothetical protein